MLIWYGVSCILIVEINNFYWEVSDSEQVIRWQTKTVLSSSIISRKQPFLCFFLIQVIPDDVFMEFEMKGSVNGHYFEMKGEGKGKPYE